MKKLFLLPLLLFSPLFALPIGNPSDPTLYRNGLFCGDCYEDRCCDPCDPCFSWCDAWDFRVGFYGDYVFNRHMKLDGHSDREVDDFEIYTNAAFLALNICDRLDVFATLGGTNINLAANPRIFNYDGTIYHRIHLETETAFSWSIGGRLAIWDCNCFNFGVEGQYFYTKPDVMVAELASGDLGYPSSQVELKYSEWQVGIGASYLVQVGCSGISAIPYVGVKWAGAKGSFSGNTITGDQGASATMFDLNNDKTWGYAVGVTLLFCDVFSITAEGRFGDEKAAYLNGQLSF